MVVEANIQQIEAPHLGGEYVPSRGEKNINVVDIFSGHDVRFDNHYPVGMKSGLGLVM